MSFLAWCYFGSNVIWFIICIWMLRQWQKEIYLCQEVLDLNHTLMELIGIPQETDLYDQDAE